MSTAARSGTRPAASEIASSELRSTMAAFATGVTVVATRHGDIVHGMTANAFSSVSLDPPLVLVCIDRSLRTHDLITEAGVFAVTVLAADQEWASRHFAGHRPLGESFSSIAWQPAGVSGCPVVADGLAFVDCSVERVLDGGDHSIFLGRVLELGILRQDCEPLIWFGSGYRELRPCAPEAS